MFCGGCNTYTFMLVINQRFFLYPVLIVLIIIIIIIIIRIEFNEEKYLEIVRDIANYY